MESVYKMSTALFNVLFVIVGYASWWAVAFGLAWLTRNWGDKGYWPYRSTR